VNQETGFLVPPDDHEALGRAMIRMASLSAEETREMAKRARLLVHEQYALGAVVDTWLDLYATCARRGDE
jgi:glycosyltransferase involved in cell wall biosynthesis